jgi:hypothetical protein
MAFLPGYGASAKRARRSLLPPVTTGIGFDPWYAGFNPWCGGAPYAYVGWNTGWRGWGMNYWW